MYLLTKSEIIIMYEICLKIFIRNRFNVCFKELYTQQPRILLIDRQHIEDGQL